MNEEGRASRSHRRRVPLSCRSVAAVAALGSTALLAAGAATTASAATHLRTTHVPSVKPFSTTLLPGARPHAALHPNDPPGVMVDAPAKAKVTATLYLALRNRQKAVDLLQQISTPTLPDGQANPRYHHYLTPAQFRKHYAPTTKTRDAVLKYFAQFGITAGQVPANNHMIVLTGRVADMSKALHVKFYQNSNGGPIVTPNTPKLPSSLKKYVEYIDGISSGAHRHMMPSHIADGLVVPVASPTAPPPPAFVDAGPFSQWWGQLPATSLPQFDGNTVPYVTQGYTPSQLRSAYSLTSNPDAGSGQTVAIVDAYASPTIRNDARFYSLLNNEPIFKPGQFSELLMSKQLRNTPAKHGDPQGWAMEETLDVEAVHAIAPGAKVLYVGGKSANNTDLEAALNTIVDNHLADVISNSWGEPQIYVHSKPWDDTFLQGDLEGISTLVSSGDSGGGDMFAGICVSWPAASPYVTGVGGTSLGVGQDGGSLWETGWGTHEADLASGSTPHWNGGNFVYGSGGGTSLLIPEPSYQKGVVPDAIAKANGVVPDRTVPDISMVGDPTTGMEIGMTMTYPDGEVGFGEFRIGGTSESSPEFAGVIARANQSAGFDHGLANPAIYALAGTQYLHDMLPAPASLAAAKNEYDNSVSGPYTSLLDTFGQDFALKLTPGWDNVTGTGAPGPGFVDALGK